LILLVLLYAYTTLAQKQKTFWMEKLSDEKENSRTTLFMYAFVLCWFLSMILLFVLFTRHFE